MRGFHHPAIEDLQLENVLYALADPVRLEIVRRLASEGVMSCTASCSQSNLPRATLSRHYDVLRAAGLVRTIKVGVQHENRLRVEELNKRFPGLLKSVLDQLEPPVKSASRRKRTKS
ncbi:MAG: helix-turn-helix domain-containing protein [Gammaproteobacteria bacterium]